MGQTRSPYRTVSCAETNHSPNIYTGWVPGTHKREGPSKGGRVKLNLERTIYLRILLDRLRGPPSAVADQSNLRRRGTAHFPLKNGFCLVGPGDPPLN
jgi:hypothetical protein